MISLPDLLHLEPRVSVDDAVLRELLDLGFLGKETGSSFDRALSEAMSERDGWQGGFFAHDLFLKELVENCFTLTLDGRPYGVNQSFLLRVLADPPTDLETVRFRQAILAELEEDEGLRRRFVDLYKDLHQFLSMLKVPGHAARLDINAFRLDLLRQAKGVVDRMAGEFSAARSGLHRLHRAGLEIQASHEYRIMDALLDYEDHLAMLEVHVKIGASGKITGLDVRAVAENADNPFYRRAWKRLWDQLRFLYYGYRWNAKDVVSRLVHEVFLRISPAFTPLIQILGHLEVYLTARALRDRARQRGLKMTPARFDPGTSLKLDELWNPLLLDKPRPVVPNSVRTSAETPTVIITGPNSGGKTRLLQAIGLAQVLGQSGLYVPAAAADLPLIQGMYVSLIESEVADAAEGRLGRELMRIRSMFEVMRWPAMVIFDELCSGTNPSEGIEVFALVLKLLERQQPVAFISTHFLDYARELEADPPVPRLEFLQVEVDDGDRSTYQFIPGVAKTSLAAVMAERLGVTFGELSKLIERRLELERKERRAAVG
ncbi:MAG: DNA mismatch repair protein [Acidobacteria bacterium]|nr:MAG: DNA mismatch repair protein [Acidobacteriota bacterium]